jgi:Response regulator containing a CheY-like receiver domain and an HTH DNA-binding domain
MDIYNKNDTIAQIACAMLKASESLIQADTYSFYLYDNLFIPVANYFPHKSYPVLNEYPVSKETPLVSYMQKNKLAVHNDMPEIRDLWVKSPQSEKLAEEGLKYVLASPLFHDDNWLGSLNFSRKKNAFTDEDLRKAEAFSRIVVLFFESCEKLFVNNIYLTVGSNNGTLIELCLNNGNIQNGESGEQLSKREMEVVDLLSKGHTYGEISNKLFLSINTVKFHIKNIYRKMGINSRIRLLKLLYGEIQ